MKIAVLSGKGGTGKTTISLNLAYALWGEVAVFDCDFECPDVLEFISCRKTTEFKVIEKLPIWIYRKCNFCRLCGRYCKFNAISVSKNKVLIFDELCNGCGVCSFICPQKAIVLKDKKTGKINKYENFKLKIFSPEIDITKNKLLPFVKKIQKLSLNSFSNLIFDCSGGISNDILRIAYFCDYVIVVAEPTLMGISDLKKVINALKKINKLFGIVINKYEKASEIDKICAELNLKVLMKIPYSEEVIKNYSTQMLFRSLKLELKKEFYAVYKSILKQISEN